MKKIGTVPVFLLFGFLWWVTAFGQEYPTKPIRIIVPLSAGAGADIAARIIAQRMNEHWKLPVIVENRPGAGGQIGTSAVVKAEADGHTLMVQSSSHAANPSTLRSHFPVQLKSQVNDVPSIVQVAACATVAPRAITRPTARAAHRPVETARAAVRKVVSLIMVLGRSRFGG